MGGCDGMDECFGPSSCGGTIGCCGVGRCVSSASAARRRRVAALIAATRRARLPASASEDLGGKYWYVFGYNIHAVGHGKGNLPGVMRCRLSVLAVLQPPALGV